jgi:hypothetical protein
MGFRERIEWLLRMAMLVFVLAAAAFLSGVTAMRFAIQGREVDMPNLVGKSSADAQALLHAHGLQIKVADRVYSDLPANAVVRQSPSAGEHMKISQDAHVVLSLGPQNVTIPGLAGEGLRIARIQLLQSGLQLGEVTSYASSDLSGDTVLQQDPPSGTRATSLRVDLLVAQDEQQPAFVMHAPGGGGTADFFRRTKNRKDHQRAISAMAKRHGDRAGSFTRLESHRRHGYRNRSGGISDSQFW